MKRIVFSTLLCGVLLYAQSVDEDLAGFDDTPTKTAKISTDDELMDGFDDTPIEAEQNLSSSSTKEAADFKSC